MKWFLIVLVNNHSTEFVSSALPHSCISSFSLFSTSSTKAGKPASSRQRRSSASRSPEGSVHWWYAIGRDSSHSPRKYWRGRYYNAWKSQCALHGWHLREVELKYRLLWKLIWCWLYAVVSTWERCLIDSGPMATTGAACGASSGAWSGNRNRSIHYSLRTHMEGLAGRSIPSLLIECPQLWQSFSSLLWGDNATNHILQRDFPLCLCSLSLEPQVCVFTFQIHK